MAVCIFSFNISSSFDSDPSSGLASIPSGMEMLNKGLMAFCSTSFRTLPFMVVDRSAQIEQTFEAVPCNSINCSNRRCSFSVSSGVSSSSLYPTFCQLDGSLVGATFVMHCDDSWFLVWPLFHFDQFVHLVITDCPVHNFGICILQFNTSCSHYLK